MAKFETLIVPRGISKLSSAVISGKGDQIGRISVLTTDGRTDGTQVQVLSCASQLTMFFFVLREAFN